MKSLGVICFVFTMTIQVLGSIYYVDASRPNDSGDALSWATAKKSIQAAIELTVDEDIVLVTNGLYNTGGAITPENGLTNRVCIAKKITVKSINGPDVTVITGKAGSSGANDTDAYRGVYMSNACTLTGFRISGGYTMWTSGTYYDYMGGGILMMDACTVSNCIISSNLADEMGAGIYMKAGGSVNNCRFESNNSGSGSGIYAYGGAIIQSCEFNKNSSGGACLHGYSYVSDCVFSKNFSNYSGGGLYIETGVVTNCCFAGNRCNPGHGGGIYVKGNTLVVDCELIANEAFSGENSGGGAYLTGGTLERCKISNNIGYNGGGVYLRNGGTLNNCVISENLSWFAGGVRFWEGGTVNNCTITLNTANSYGGGVHFYQGGTLNNSIVWGNTCSNGKDIYTYKSSIIQNVCASDGITAGSSGCIMTDPRLAPDSITLFADSPCINAGNSTYSTSGTDFFGNPRIMNTAVEIGAYEYYEPSGDFDGDGLPNDWEMEYFDSIVSATPQDLSANGINSVQEAYIAGLNPNDPDALFTCSLSPNCIIEWNSVSGRVYEVWSSTNLTDGIWNKLNVNLAYPQNSLTISNVVQTATTPVFFKMKVSLEDD